MKRALLLVALVAAVLATPAASATEKLTVTVGSVTYTEATLSWGSTGDWCHEWYALYVDGVLVAGGDNTPKGEDRYWSWEKVTGFAPGTTHSAFVRNKDCTGYIDSAPVSFTTLGCGTGFFWNGSQCVGSGGTTPGPGGQCGPGLVIDPATGQCIAAPPPPPFDWRILLWVLLAVAVLAALGLWLRGKIPPVVAGIVIAGALVVALLVLFVPLPAAQSISGPGTAVSGPNCGGVAVLKVEAEDFTALSEEFYFAGARSSYGAPHGDAADQVVLHRDDRQASSWWWVVYDQHAFAPVPLGTTDDPSTLDDSLVIARQAGVLTDWQISAGLIVAGCAAGG